jgi:uncharacterized protein YhbP (UPF0306 family)
MATETPVTDVPSHVLDFLGEKNTLTLASASRRAIPWATTLAYANDGVALYVWMRPETTTAEHIEENQVVSFAIDEYSADWQDTKGIQGLGECRTVLNAEERRRAISLFETKFPALSGALSSGVSIYRISPTQLQFIDNSAAGEGKKTEFRKDLVYNIFGDLPEQEADTLAAKLNTTQVGAGDLIVRQGAPADKFFIIVDGEVEVLREEGGQSHTVATLGRGQFFGEIAILRDTPRMATVRAKTAAVLFAMDRDVFRSLVAQSMGTTADFDSVVRRRLDELGAR